MSANSTAQQEISIDDETVAAYLRERPDFFKDNEELLADMQLPHEGGGAVSLVERQLAVLRERNQEMRTRLTKLIDAARENDHLFEHTRRLVLSLVSAESLEGTHKALQNSLSQDFDVEFSNLCLLGEPGDVHGIRRVDPAAARAAVGKLLDSRQVICGIFRPAETEFLFGGESSEIQSAALIPIGRPAVTGILAVGSRDPHHYKNGMGTLFLSYIGEILTEALPRYL